MWVKKCMQYQVLAAAGEQGFLQSPRGCGCLISASSGQQAPILQDSGTTGGRPSAQAHSGLSTFWCSGSPTLPCWQRWLQYLYSQETPRARLEWTEDRTQGPHETCARSTVPGKPVSSLCYPSFSYERQVLSVPQNVSQERWQTQQAVLMLSNTNRFRDLLYNNLLSDRTIPYIFVLAISRLFVAMRNKINKDRNIQEKSIN